MLIIIFPFFMMQVLSAQDIDSETSRLEFRDLVGAAEVIVVADELNAQPETRRLADTASFQIREVLTGKAEVVKIAKVIHVAAPSEFRNRNSPMGSWLLFLKWNDEETLVPAVDGVSAWPLLWPTWYCDCSGNTWRLPAELIAFPDSELISTGCFGDWPSVCGPDLRAFIDQARVIPPTPPPS